MKWLCGLFGLLGIACYWPALPFAGLIIHAVGGHAYFWMVVVSLLGATLSLVETACTRERTLLVMAGMVLDSAWAAVFLSPYGFPVLATIYDLGSRAPMAS